MSITGERVQVSTEALEVLKRSKASYLGNVHRKAQAVEEGLARGNDVEDLESQIAEYEDAFRKFMNAHESYLEAEVTTERREQAIAIYEVETYKKATLQIAARKYKREAAGERPSKASDFVSVHSERTQSSRSTRSSVRERKRLAEARLKLQAIERKHEIERQLLLEQRERKSREDEMRREIEFIEANTEVKIAEAGVQIEEELVETVNDLFTVNDITRNDTRMSSQLGIIPVIPQYCQALNSYDVSIGVPISQTTFENHPGLGHISQTSSRLPPTEGRQVSMHSLVHSYRPYTVHTTPRITPAVSSINSGPITLSCAPSSSDSHGVFSPTISSPPFHGNTGFTHHVDFPSGHTLHNQNNTAVSPIESSSQTRNCLPPGTNDRDKEMSAWLTIADAIRQGPSLPRVELLKFDGNPVDFVEFRTNFVNNIELQVHDPSQRLTRLLAQCQGKARDAIKACVNLPVIEGYDKAWEILYQNFGKPHIVAEAQISILKQLDLKSVDAFSMMSFGRKLENAWQTLNSMGQLYASGLDNEDLIKTMMRKFPIEALKRKWVERAGDLIENKGQVQFIDFIEFVKRLGSRLNNSFGKELKSGPVKTEQNKGRSYQDRGNKITTLLTQGGQKTKLICANCGASHGIWRCEKFIELSREEKLKKIRELGLCRACLEKGHFARSCPRKFTCRVKDCGQPHHVLIHPEHENRPAIVNEAGSTGNNLTVVHDSSCNSIKGNKAKVWFKVVPVKIFNKDSKKSTVVNAFLDSGSDTTICTKKLLKQLEAPTTHVKYNMTTVNGEKEVDGALIDFNITSLENGQEFLCKDVLAVETIPVMERNIASNEELKEWPHLSSINLHISDKADVDILIGSDHPEITEEVIDFRKGAKGEPVAIKGPLGWVVCGPTGSLKDAALTVHFCQVDRPADIEQEIKNLYDRDFLDKAKREEQHLSVQDKRALNIMEESAKVVNGHYQVNLPFKEDEPTFPDSRQTAEKRLSHLKSKFQRSPDFREKYTQVIKRYEEEGSTRKLTEKEIELLKNPWYLPHHAVWHPKKPGEPRVVFDCAAKSSGLSLNDFLLKGPENTSSLIGVLCRFRVEKIGVTADIKRMFHQVFVAPEDQRALCYLWWPDGDIDQPAEVWSMLVNIFGAKSSPSVCGFALRKTAADNTGSYSKETIDSVYKNFYVDDWLMSFPNEEQAIKIIEEICSLLKRGGFHLTKFASSHRDVTETVPPEERVSSMKDLDLRKDALPTERALGLQWDVEDDHLKIAVGTKQYEATRRGVLSSVASIYDPLGFVSPLVLPGKEINQELCKRTWGWDDPLPPDLLSRWESWCNDLKSLHQVSIPRCFRPEAFRSADIQLHHFSDASENHGYGVSSYIRLANREGEFYTSFLFGKSRVRPLKSGVTVPKLELTAAVLAVDVNEMLVRELGDKVAISRTVFWTDSIIVLRYIRNESRRFTTFVANRVSKIREYTSVDQWKYVPTKQNVADIASRGLKITETAKLEIWKKGPEFLREQEERWPDQPLELCQSLKDGDEGIRKEKVRVNAVSSQVEFWSSFVMKYSSWRKLRRVCATVIRAKQKFKSLQTKDTMSVTEEFDRVISVEELKEAERMIVKNVQKEVFVECELSDKGRVKGQLARLKPIIVDGVLRVGGRLGNSHLGFDSKHPMIIPSRHHVTTIIINHFHIVNGHAGTQQVLAEVRKRFWVLSGVVTVRRALRKCHFCRRLNATAGEQILAPLPEVRVSSDTEGLIYPFAATGIDFFGPLHTTKGRATRSSRKEVPVNKRYGCIFTCLRYRAVHLELVKDLTTDSFINAVLRFVARRGPPRVIYSDNGTNFKGAEKDILRAMRSWNFDVIEKSCSDKFIRWRFNPPGASHQGGIWERMIRMVRRILCSLLRNRLVDDETLMTLFCEVEKIVNDRPITRLAEDPESLDALTPSQILLLRGNSSAAPAELQDVEKIKARWKEASLLANRFWSRWQAEYLPTLQERQKWLEEKRNFAVGDLVLIIDSNIPRGRWNKGLIVETYPDKQNVVRRVLIRTATGTFMRDIRKVCLLEEQLIQAVENEMSKFVSSKKTPQSSLEGEDVVAS